MRQQQSPTTRTSFAERQVEEFLSIPLVAEFVFRSPQKIDGTQREVADFLLLHQERGILISQKCQEDPLGRDADRTERWARKKATDAASQLRGALRAGAGTPVWAEHPRRGRVDFPEGLPPIVHGIVTVEVFQPVDLEPESANLPLRYQDTPVTYLSVNDFLNLAVALRTVPELLAYLAARRSLPIPELRIIGDERPLFEFYLLNDGSFGGCVGRGDARVAIAAQADRLQEMLASKRESDHYGGLLEHVADALATRNPEYAAGLRADLLAAYDPSEQRSTYLEMQTLLADLRLRERSELGRAFDECSKNVSGKSQGFTFRATHLDSKPDWVYVFGASKNSERPTLLQRLDPLMRGAMACYDKPRCLLVIDLDGTSYEAAISPPGFQPTLADHEIGQRLFGRLRITSKRLGLVVPAQPE